MCHGLRVFEIKGQKGKSSRPTFYEMRCRNLRVRGPKGAVTRRMAVNNWRLCYQSLLSLSYYNTTYALRIGSFTIPNATSKPIASESDFALEYFYNHNAK